MKRKLLISLSLFCIIIVLFFFALHKVLSEMSPDNRTGMLDSTLQKSMEGFDLRTVYKTNSWFSSAYQFPSSPMFIYPGAYQITNKGVGISVPQVKGVEKTIFGSYDELCVISDGSTVSKSVVHEYGDWNATIGVGNELVFYFTQGSPVTYFGGHNEIHVSCRGAQIAKSDTGVVITRGNAVLLFQSKSGQDVRFINEGDLVLTSDSDAWRVSILPDSSERFISLFGDYPWSRITSTAVSYAVADTVTTKWSFGSDNNGKVLTTIWPHHDDVKDVSKIESAIYRTVLGDMHLVETEEFTSTRVLPKLGFSFTAVTDAKRSGEIKQAIIEDTKRYLKETPPEGVYFKGTWLGALTSLIQLADTYGMTSERDQLLNRLESILKTSLGEFEYDEKLHLLKAKKPEFGNEHGNDHHFHYGYYIRASAVLVRFKPETIDWSKPVISEMIEDIASFDRRDISRYPFLRYFSPYEGHSWADGRGGFPDGNNQESTSEALNAWYAITMWGEVTNEKQLVERGTWLFAEEFEGASKYWFGKNNQFANGYTSPIASLVWGGKRDFSTWFSADPMHIVGIQILPITPASEYLATVGNANQIRSFLSEKSPNALNHEWTDLYLAYISYVDPEFAVSRVNSVSKHDGMKLRSLFLQTVYSNSEK